MGDLDNQITDLKQKEAELLEDIRVKRIEYERAEKRLESLNNAKPAHFGEIRQLEAELSHVYRIYVEKIRNHDFLANKLETYQKLEEDQNKNRDREIKAIRENNIRLEQRNLNDENDELNAAEYDDAETYHQNAIKQNVKVYLKFLEQPPLK